MPSVSLAFHISLNKVNGSNFFPFRVNLIFETNQILFKIHSSEDAIEVCETKFSQQAEEKKTLQA